MDLEARVKRLEEALWFEKGRSQVLERTIVGLLGGLKAIVPDSTDRLLSDLPIKYEDLFPPNDPIGAAFRSGVEETLQSLRNAVQDV